MFCQLNQCSQKPPITSARVCFPRGRSREQRSDRACTQQGWRYPGTIKCPQCPAGLLALRVAVLARCLCCRMCWIRSLCPLLFVSTCGPACPRAPGLLQCPFPGCPRSPEPRELLCAGSRLPAPRSARGNIPSRLRELSTPQIARPAWPPAGALRPRRWPADDLTAREAPNMLLLPIKSKGLWAWNHREHRDCASQGRRSREAALLGRRKDRGS